MQLIKRAPGDSYTLSKFFKAKQRLGLDIDSCYLWSLHFNPFPIGKINKAYIEKYNLDYTLEQINYYTNSSYVDRAWVTNLYKKLSYANSFNPVANLYRDILIKNISTPTVLLGVKDHLTPSQFNPWIEERPWLVNPILEIFRHHSDKNFVLLTSMENLNSYVTEPNVTIIPWSGDLSNHLDHYKKIEPVTVKNLESSRSFLSLNRHNRNHRIHLVSLLLSLELDQMGLISCMFKGEAVDSIDQCRWEYHNQTIKTIYEKGYSKISTCTFPIDDHYEIYDGIANDNVSNFNRTLRNYYQETFIEFVAETSYTETCFLITEKTANSILGCCFPIWISSKGTVEFLRSTGFDVFDDIIDHSYDTVDDPAERLYRAVIDNLELLVDVAQVKQLWVDNQSRFLNNVEYFRTDLWRFYNTRFDSLLDKLS